ATFTGVLCFSNDKNARSSAFSLFDMMINSIN
ncbi:MAG: hypothetical protein ACJA0G_002565, partial [Kangiellaceae bacterium]